MGGSFGTAHVAEFTLGGSCGFTMPLLWMHRVESALRHVTITLAKRLLTRLCKNSRTNYKMEASLHSKRVEAILVFNFCVIKHVTMTTCYMQRNRGAAVVRALACHHCILGSILKAWLYQQVFAYDGDAIFLIVALLVCGENRQMDLASEGHSFVSSVQDCFSELMKDAII